MSESCEILVTQREDGQVVAGEIILEDGELTFYATKGYGALMENIITGKTFVGERVFDPTIDPIAWLQSLPCCYTGSIVRAQLVNF